MPGIDLGSPETVMNQGYCLQGTYISREKIKVKDKKSVNNYYIVVNAMEE